MSFPTDDKSEGLPDNVPKGTMERLMRRVLSRHIGGAVVMVCLVVGARDGFASREVGIEGVSTLAPAFHPSASDVEFQHLNLNNGLANPVVQAFAEDGDGFLWVGSQSGLQRWDGYRFWNYKQVLGSATSLPDNLVQSLYTDSQGRLWVGTSSGGLARYNREEDKFVQYRSSNNGVNGANVFAITGDGARGVWVGSNTGLDHLNADSGRFEHVSLTQEGGRTPQHASALLRGADGALWVGTELGLQRCARPDPYNPTRNEFKPVSLPVAKTGTGSGTTEVVVLFRDRDGRVWVGTAHGIYVIGRQDGAQGAEFSARAVIAKGPGAEMLSSQHYLSIAETSVGEVWLGTQDEGIMALTPAKGVPANAKTGDTVETVGEDKASWEVRHIAHDDAVPTSLSDDLVYGLHLDRSGIMWIATRQNVSYLDTTPKSAFTLRGGAAPTNVIRDKNVYSVLARRDGSVWLALGHEGLDILDANGQRAAQLSPGKVGSDTTLPPGSLNGLVESGNGSVFLTTSRGLYQVTPVEKGGGRQGPPRLSRVPIGPDAATNLTKVLPDHGKLWIGGDNGLWLLDSTDGSQGPAKRPEMRGALSDQRVTVLMRGAEPSLWIGTQNGVSRLDLTTHAVEAILPDAADPAALGAGYVSSLLTDHKGRLWVGTFSGGIDVLEGRDGQGKPRFHRIIEGLPNENIDMLLQAYDGKIWASTDGGLAVIDPDTFEIKVLRPEDGASLQAYWNGSGAITARGELIFGGIGGITVARPGMARPWDYQPPVVVTNARIGEFEIPTSRFNSGLDVYPVWIPSDQNNLTVGFTALDYTSPTRNRYEYKLEGFDRDWIAADATRRLARYTNLPPGDYMLLLRGSNRDGLWAPVRQVRIRVVPAWFQTWWFKIIAVLLGVLLIYLLVLAATAYLRRQQHELERQVALRTRELEQRTVELKESEQRLEHMAYTDALTGLPNRRMFTEHFKRLLALKRREDSSFSLLLMDFDKFKRINDTYGHDAGDAVLIEMARRLSMLVRESDCLARLGGDEFGLLLGQSHDLEGTEMVCRKVVQSFESPVVFEGAELRTAPSIGIALYPFDGESQDRLYKTADMALYQAKRNGGNGCSWSNAVSPSAEVN